MLELGSWKLEGGRNTKQGKVMMGGARRRLIGEERSIGLLQAFDDAGKDECLADSLEVQCSPSLEPVDPTHILQVDSEVELRATLTPSDPSPGHLKGSRIETYNKEQMHALFFSTAMRSGSKQIHHAAAPMILIITKMIMGPQEHDALVEKFLRSCPDVGTIYLLIRVKKGLSTDERLKELISQRVFDLVRENNPNAFKKLRIISGDILEPELGISEQDKQLLRDTCHVVFHSAACVRFDQKLKDAVAMNTTGTLLVLQLAESMKKLEVFVHLSTAYCRCHLDVLEEKLYPAVHKPRRIMDITQWMDDELLDHLEPKLIQSEPNTYSYTKAITEDLVAEYGSKFPLAIARPSIVLCAWKDPYPGWVDNLNGPTGLLIASGKGVIRTMHCEPSYTADAMPVDVTANGCILLAYATALDKPKEVRVYNITLSGMIKIKWEDIIELGRKWVNVYPHTVALWYPGGSVKSYWWTHQLCVIFLHIIPAYFIDMLLFLLGRKTFMVNLQKRISHGLNVIQYYTTKEWYFTNNNFKALRDRISKEDDETFYTDVTSVVPDDFLRDYVLGARQFCCKEDPSTLPRAKKLHKIRYIADAIAKIVLLGLLLWFMYSYSHLFSTVVGTLDSTLKNLSPIDQVKAEGTTITSSI
ncbi:fatty acyl-CoA reductase 1-like [Hyposmocoma kahamanoa]|uniref:fatty acyl-CoA reductase 1-like n=1 Tax=Hyposmocoma kahamanoa TaxID=1477025 RepID=UPI000E6D6F2B|nr:fatty acyl-CoA reductase 1-like [Hyposmocoma kahamanoa]